MKNTYVLSASVDVEKHSYFDDLAPFVNKHLELYKDDFYKLDRKVLTAYKGLFLFCIRPSGTDLITFSKSVGREYVDLDEKQITEAKDLAHSLIFRNTHFFIPMTKKVGVRKVSKKQALAFFEKNYSKFTGFYL